jgi:hypothetical protein
MGNNCYCCTNWLDVLWGICPVREKNNFLASIDAKKLIYRVSTGNVIIYEREKL